MSWWEWLLVWLPLSVVVGLVVGPYLKRQRPRARRMPNLWEWESGEDGW